MLASITFITIRCPTLTASGLFVTYTGNGELLPSFRGEPFPVPIIGTTTEEIAANFWGVLCEEHRYRWP